MPVAYVDSSTQLLHNSEYEHPFFAGTSCVQCPKMKFSDLTIYIHTFLTL